MELFFTDDEFILNKKVFTRIPFLLNKEMQLVKEPNDYLFHIAVTYGKTNSKYTWETYGRNLCDFFNWLEINELNWIDIKSHHIGAYREALKSNVSSITGRTNCYSTINQRLSQVLRFYKKMCDERVITSLPFSMQELKLNATGGMLAHTNLRFVTTADVLLKTHKKEPKYLSFNEAKKFIDEGFQNQRARLMAMLLLQSGMRRMEVTLLPTSVIYEAEKSFSQKVHTNTVFLNLPAEICKNNKARTVVVSKLLLAKILHYIKLTRPHLEKIYSANQADKSQKSSRVWLSQLGAELSVTCLNRDFQKASEITGIKCTPHMLRHTFSTHFYLKCKNLRELQKLLGHSSITTTQIYEHSTPYDQLGFMDDLQESFDELFGKGN